MRTEKVRSRLEQIQPIFDVSFNPLPNKDESLVWCGVSGIGGIDEILPILFYEHSGGPEKVVPSLKKLLREGEMHPTLKPLLFADSHAGSVWECKIKYQIQTISPENIDFSYQLGTGIEAVAERWCSEYASDSTRSKIEYVGGGNLSYKLRVSIFTAIFQTGIPVFQDPPTTSSLEKQMADIMIPCVTLVDNHDASGQVIRKFQTEIEPVVINTE